MRKCPHCNQGITEPDSPIEELRRHIQSTIDAANKSAKTSQANAEACHETKRDRYLELSMQSLKTSVKWQRWLDALDEIMKPKESST